MTTIRDNTRRFGDWMVTFTGKRYWPLDPRPEDVSIEDIAHHLSLICRFGGACRTFYSVAQHSTLLSEVAEENEHDFEFIKWCLLHDAAEAYIGDMVRPLKKQLQEYDELDDRNLNVIATKFGLAWPVPSEVKELDNALLFEEARFLLRTGSDGWSGRPEKKLDLVEFNFNPLPPQIAKFEFLKRFELLGIRSLV